MKVFKITLFGLAAMFLLSAWIIINTSQQEGTQESSLKSTLGPWMLTPSPTPTIRIIDRQATPSARPTENRLTQPNQIILTATPTPPLGLKQELESRPSKVNALAVAPANDDFDSAALISAFPFTGDEDTTGASVAGDDPLMGCGAGVNSNTIWYRFIAPSNGKLHSDTFGSDYDTVLAAFTGTRGALTAIACNDDYSGVQSQIEFQAYSGQTYYLEVADYGDPGGGQLHFTFDFTPSPQIDVPLDIVLVQDETASMGDDISGLQSLAPQIWDSINGAALEGFQMSVVGFRDYAQNDWGCDGDWVYRRLTDFTTNRDQFTNAVNSLTASGGCDSPEAQYAALDYLLTTGHACIDSNGNGNCSDSFDTPVGQQPHFRSGAARVILLATDANFHDPNNTSGYPGPTRDTVVNKLRANRTIVIGLVPGGAGMLPEVDDLTAITGGSTQNTGSTGSDVADAIAAALAQIRPVSAMLSTVSVEPNTVSADGSTTATVTVTILDTAGNPVAGKTVILTSDRGGSDIIVQPSLPTDVNGQTTGSISSLQSGTATLTAIDVTDNIIILNQSSLQFTENSLALRQRINTYNVLSHNALSSLAIDAQGAGANGDYFRGAITANAAQTAISAWSLLSGTLEGVDDIEKLQGGVQLALPGVTDTGESVLDNFENEYPQSGDLFNLTWQDAIDSGNYKGLTRPVLDAGSKYFAAKFLKEGVDELTQDEVVNAWQQLTSSSGGFTAAGNWLSSDIGNLQLDLNSQRDDLLNDLPVMSDTQQAAYTDDLRKRSMVPVVLQDAAWHQAALLDNVRSANESIGGGGLTSFVLKFFADALATATFDGPGHLVVNGITNGIDLYINARKLDASQRAFDQAPSILKGVADASVKTYADETTGYYRVKNLLPPNPVTGQIEDVRNYSEGTLFIGAFYSEDTSYSEIDLQNTSSETGAFEVIAQYGYNSRIFGLPWAYMPMVKSDAIILEPGESGTVRIYYKQWEKGGSPEDGSDINFDVLASNGTGTFYIDHRLDTWNPLEESSSGEVSLSRASLETTPVIENPIDSYIFSNPADQTYQDQIWISNPFSQTIQATIQQDLPAGITVLTTDGTQTGSTISWQKDVAANDIVSVAFSFRYSAEAGASLSLPAATISFVEPTSGQSVDVTSNSPAFTGLTPIEVQGHTPLGAAGLTSKMPVTVTNLVGTPENGTLTIDISDGNGTQVYTDTKSFNVGGSGNQTLTFTLPALPVGFYPLESHLTINGTTLNAFGDTYEVVSLQTITGNTGGSGVTLTYTVGSSPRTVTSDMNGNYTISVPTGWSGIVAASKQCNSGRYSLKRCIFLPVEISYTDIQTDQSQQNYSLMWVY
jgi:hypothetical protein